MDFIISGCNGHMGHVLTELAKTDPLIQIVAGFDIAPSSEARNFPVYASPLEFSGHADCVIDFSSPNALDDLLRFGTERKIPLVLATTGYSEAQIQQIAEAAKQIPIFRSANMSVGINVLIKLIQEAAAKLSGYDIEIIEQHHNRKVDAPSGTALMLADAASGALPYDATYAFDRSQRRQKRPQNEIGISSIRGGTIVGEHSVIFAGHDEVIELRHSAQSRELFAVGALRAAKYLSNVKAPGLYDMQRLLEDEQ